MKFRRRGDLAFLETVLVGLGVLVIAILYTPATWEELQHRAQIQALGDTQRIAAALTHYRQDTGTFPETNSGGQALDYLKSADPVPADERWTTGAGEALTAFLIHSSQEHSGWKGPYLQKSPLDPWGHAYVVNARGLREGSAQKSWVISAGPNGKFDTLPGEGRTSGDDVGVLAN